MRIIPELLNEDRCLGPPSESAIARFSIEERPHLIVIVDAEEEFDWNASFSRDATSTRSIACQSAAQRILDEFGIVPTYAVDYPVASQPRAYEPIKQFLDEGRCDLAVHLHPWVNPPFREELNERNSYPGNLPPSLEKEKLVNLKQKIEENFGLLPTIYRAGRYGLGVNTPKLLYELGFSIDCSVLPHLRVHEGGPDYRGFPESPYWFGPDERLLEFPTTVGLVGSLGRWGRDAYELASDRRLSRLRLPGVLSRLGLIERIQLSPEGSNLEEAKRLTTSLIERNHLIFVISYHSTSLMPGNTPYVRDDEDLSRFLGWLREYCEFFFVQLNGTATTLVDLQAKAVQVKSQGPAPEQRFVSNTVGNTPISQKHLGSTERRSLANEKRPVKCLLITSTFPPLVGGTCVVYHNLCKYGGGMVIALAPYINFATGMPYKGVEDYDRNSPYKIYRRALLRPQHQFSRPPWLIRLARGLTDLWLLTGVLATVVTVVVRERINVLCIGELTYCGWLVVFCKYILGIKTIVYVHGEEITTLGPGLGERLKFVWLRFADAVVSVSSFTARSMVERAGLKPARIHIIPNGVDTAVFRPRPINANLVKRYKLHGGQVLLSVGRLVERKGIDHVLKAFPAVLIRHPDSRYLIVGDGPYRSKLENIVQDLGISQHVIFAGEVSSDELVDHYALADIFVLPNRQLEDGDTEGFGLVFLEANACGKPVIAGKAGGAPDAVTDGENGLLVDGNDVTAIAEAIDLLLRDQKLCAKLREGAMARAARSTWKDRVDEFRALCNSL